MYEEIYGFQRATGTGTIRKPPEEKKLVVTWEGNMVPHQDKGRRRQYLEDVKDWLTTQLALVEQELQGL